MHGFWKYKLDQLIFWVATVGFHMFTRLPLIGKAGIAQFLLEVVLRNGLLAILIVVNLSILIPRYAQKKRIGMYILLLLGMLVLYIGVKNAHDTYLYGYRMGDALSKDFFYNTYYNFSIAVFYLSFSVALYLSREWYRQRDLIRRIEIEKLNTELEFLKAQINPHFIFNSLNTIYFQIDKHNTAARNALAAFSALLRYQLYDCSGKEIGLDKEISYIQSYVDLQRMRKDDHYHISFVSAVGRKDFTIAPLLLIPFVENAFKHVSHTFERNEVTITLYSDNRSLSLYVFNTRDKREKNGSVYAGIGLKNVKRRLELLYSNRHMLSVRDTPQTYEVTLQINFE